MENEVKLSIGRNLNHIRPLAGDVPAKIKLSLEAVLGSEGYKELC